ncbi:MAG: hypothetical protein ACI3ZT_00840 [Candidatus Cryptobacteroides sp.]
MSQTNTNKRTTRKDEKNWIAGIVSAIPADRLNESGDPFKTVAEDIQRIMYDRNGKSYYKTAQDAAEHYLRGLGLHGFPYTNEDHAAILTGWGFKATDRNIERFWGFSAGLLVEVLQDNGLTI